jgi:hypothetical protein
MKTIIQNGHLRATGRTDGWNYRCNNNNNTVCRSYLLSALPWPCHRCIRTISAQSLPIGAVYNIGLGWFLLFFFFTPPQVSHFLRIGLCTHKYTNHTVTRLVRLHRSDIIYYYYYKSQYNVCVCKYPRYDVRVHTRVVVLYTYTSRVTEFYFLRLSVCFVL